MEPAAKAASGYGIGRVSQIMIPFPELLYDVPGGWGGIRTHGGLAPTPVFKTGAFNHSATHPGGRHNAQAPHSIKGPTRPKDTVNGKKR